MQRKSLQFHEFDEQEMINRSSRFRDHMLRRRTVRDFDSRAVPKEVVDDALRVAASAPSGANRQPWRFVVIEDRETKQQIQTAAEKEEQEFYENRAPDDWLLALEPLGTNQHKPFLTEAPLLIAVFLEKYGLDDIGNRIKNYYTPESVGIATGFLLASLHHAGLATLTHTPSPMKFLNKILNRPSRERPYVLLVVGYPKRNATVPVIQKLPMETISSWI